MKLTEEEVGLIHQDTDISKNFLNRILVPQEIRLTLDKLELTKLKSFCTAKETINPMKRQPTEWEEIIATVNQSSREDVVTRLSDWNLRNCREVGMLRHKVRLLDHFPHLTQSLTAFLLWKSKAFKAYVGLLMAHSCIWEYVVYDFLCSVTIEGSWNSYLIET